MTPERLVEQIKDELTANNVQLPTLPEIALRLRDIAHDPTLKISDVTRMIEADAALTVYLLHAVNTPIFRGHRPVDSVSSAIARLGLETTSDLAMDYAVRSLFRPRIKALERFYRRQWQLSAHLAALARSLANCCTGFRPGRALVAALFQDIGALPLLQRLGRYPEMVTSDNAVLGIIERYTGELGAELLQRWHFEEDFVEVARSRKQWFRDAGDKPDYADLVMVARLHRYMGTPFAAGLPDITRIPAFRKIAVRNLNPKISLAVLEEARTDVSELRKLLAN